MIDKEYERLKEQRKKRKRKPVFDYLKDKEYNIMLERLLYMLPGRNSEDLFHFEFEDGESAEDLFGNFATSKVYAYSNEYLDAIFNDIEIEGGRALVVGSSGDQALHCIEKGASEVTIVDGNMWTKPFVELKLAAIKNLNFNEFNQYFTYGRIFSPKFYAKVSHDLSEETRAFWDNIMLNFGMDYMIKGPEKFLHNTLEGEDFDRGREYHSYYTSEDAFNRVKSNLLNCKVNIEIAELEDFPDVAEGQYDLIMLSNIFDYVKNDTFFSVLRELNDEHLLDTGEIQAYYTLGKRKNSSTENFISGLKKFAQFCKDGGIKINAKDVSMEGGFLRNWIKGYPGQKNVMLKKSDFSMDKDN